MKVYSIDLINLRNNYTNSELIALYAEGKKLELEEKEELFKLNIKAVRGGIAEAFTGKNAIKEKDEAMAEEDIFAQAGFEYKQV